MCEFNNPFPPSFCKNPGAYLPPANLEPIVRPHSELMERLAQLAIGEQDIILNAIEEAAPEGYDVHLYRSATSPYLGLAFRPGTGPNVKVWEH